jgi:hypothetical protein
MTSKITRTLRAFRACRSCATARDLLAEAISKESSGAIDDDTFLDVLADILDFLSSRAEPGPIVVALEGGRVQAAVSDDSTLHDIEVIVIDYDTDGADRIDLMDVPQSDPTGEAEALVYCHKIGAANGINLPELMRRLDTKESQPTEPRYFVNELVKGHGDSREFTGPEGCADAILWAAELAKAALKSDNPSDHKIEFGREGGAP